MELRKVLVVVCLLPTVFGCSCFYPPRYSTPLGSLCNDYQWSGDVFAGRVINASCNCIPPRNDSSYGPADISCLSGDVTQYFTTEVVAGATCDVEIRQYGLISCDRVLNKFQPIECPYEGQVFMDCVSLCPTTCSNMGVTSSPCPRVCVEGCGCPEDMVINEEQGRCMMPSQCPDQACPLVSQVTSTCASSCPRDCLRPGNESCVQLCDVCTCPPPTIADYITGKCVQPEQCTACPIEGQVFTECGSSCPLTCDNVNDTISCDTSCWQGCECPSGMVIDVKRRKCVEASQCTRQPPTITAWTSENGRCERQFTCPFNIPQNDYNPCQYAVEVTEVFKGEYQVGQTISHYGPDLLTSCGNPENILSVGTTYLVGIGGPCSAHAEWTPYSQYPAELREALLNGCSNSSVSVMMTPSSASVYPTSTSQLSETPSGSVSVTMIPSSPSVYPTSTSRVNETFSGAKSILPSDVIIPVTAIVIVLYF